MDVTLHEKPNFVSREHLAIYSNNSMNNFMCILQILKTDSPKHVVADDTLMARRRYISASAMIIVLVDIMKSSKSVSVSIDKMTVLLFVIKPKRIWLFLCE